MSQAVYANQFFQVLFKKAVASFDEEKKSVIIEGYASTEEQDRHGDIVAPEAFSKALGVYMKNPVILLQHDLDKPIGKVIRAEARDDGLFVRAEVFHEETIESIENGVLKAFSIGFYPLLVVAKNVENGEELPLDQWQNLGFEEMSKFSPYIKELELVEISIVSVPSNRNSLFTLAKSLKSFIHKNFNMPDITEKDAEDVTPPEVQPEEAKEPEVAEEPAKEPEETTEPEAEASEEPENSGETPEVEKAVPSVGSEELLTIAKGFEAMASAMQAMQKEIAELKAKSHNPFRGAVTVGPMGRTLEKDISSSVVPKENAGDSLGRAILQAAKSMGPSSQSLRIL